MKPKDLVIITSAKGEATQSALYDRNAPDPVTAPGVCVGMLGWVVSVDEECGHAAVCVPGTFAGRDGAGPWFLNISDLEMMAKAS